MISAYKRHFSVRRIENLATIRYLFPYKSLNSSINKNHNVL